MRQSRAETPKPRVPHLEPAQTSRLPDRRLRPQQHHRPVSELPAGTAVYLHLRASGLWRGGRVLRLHGLSGGAAGVWAGDRLLPLPQRRRARAAGGVRDRGAHADRRERRIFARRGAVAAAHRRPAAPCRPPGIHLVGRRDRRAGLGRRRRLCSPAGGGQGAAFRRHQADRDRRQHRPESVLYPGLPAGLRGRSRLPARPAVGPGHRHRLCLPGQPGRQRAQDPAADATTQRRSVRRRGDLRRGAVQTHRPLLAADGDHRHGRHRQRDARPRGAEVPAALRRRHQHGAARHL